MNKFLPRSLAAKEILVRRHGQNITFSGIFIQSKLLSAEHLSLSLEIEIERRNSLARIA
jgi:hypothetical protein